MEKRGQAGTGLLSTKQAARRGGVSRDTVLRAMRRGEVTPALRTPGGAYRFHPDAIAAYAARRAGAGTAPLIRSGDAGEADAAQRGLERLLAATNVPHIRVDALITRVLATLAESLDVAVTSLARVAGPTLHIERVHDRGGLDLRAGAIIPLCDTYCRTVLEGARGLAIEDARVASTVALAPPACERGVGSYSGTPLARRDGTLYGTLCTLDSRPRSITPGEMTLLALAGRLVMQAIEHAEGEARIVAARRESEARLRAVLDAAPVALSVFDADGVITLSTGRALAAVGSASGDSVGHSVFARYAAYPDICAAARRALDGEARRCVVNIADAVFDIHYTPLHIVDGQVAEVIAVATDVTTRARAEEALRWQATHDPLTGLPNRHLLYERLERALALGQRARTKPALLFLDLDGFKAVNDTLGHETGDLLLREVARRLRGCLRESDTVARLGGDEFVVLLPAVGARDQAAVVANKALATLNAPYDLGGRTALVGVSIGISVAAPDASDPGALIAMADSALYRAKREGKGRYAVTDAVATATDAARATASR